MIALLCSVPQEAEYIRSCMAIEESLSAGSRPVFTGTLSKQRIALCIGGMGKANAAHAATLLITRFNPEALIIFGIGGAYPASGAAVGELALATEEVAGDEGVITQAGFKDTEYIGIPLVKTDTTAIYNRFPAPEQLLRQAQKSLSKAQTNRVHTGTFVTLSACTGTSARARELESRYHALCENMEGAAAAQVASLHNVPWLELRGISNLVEDRDLNKWNIPKAAEAAQKAVLRILEGWRG